MGEQLLGWSMLILFFVPFLAILIADLPGFFALAVEYHAWLVPAFVTLAILIVAGFLLMNTAFEVMERAADSGPEEHIDG